MAKVDMVVLLCSILAFMVFSSASAAQCGAQADGALCSGGLCCSKWGWCGNTPDYTGNATTQKRELAAFFGQTSHETTGGWASAPDGPYAWGYCFIREIAGGDYCANTELYPCASGQQYYGRGPIQLSWNYNYIQAGNAIGFDGLHDPDIVARNATLSFETAIWFWMTAQPPKPSCHEVMIGTWNPSSNDEAAGRKAGYGLTTNIINGGLECGYGENDKVKSRIGFYQRYCNILGVNEGTNVDCYNQRPYGLALSTAEEASIIKTVV